MVDSVQACAKSRGQRRKAVIGQTVIPQARGNLRFHSSPSPFFRKMFHVERRRELRILGIVVAHYYTAPTLLEMAI